MSHYKLSAVQMSIVLRNLGACLKKASGCAEAKGTSADDYLQFRLSPDMRPFVFQIQASCDTAKFAAARLAAVEPPKHPDEEATMHELEQRIASTVEFLDGLQEGQFEGAGEREVRLSFLPGMAIKGDDYLREFAIPNFYFHVTTAYALLRLAGVGLGKRDFIGEKLSLYPVED